MAEKDIAKIYDTIKHSQAKMVIAVTKEIQCVFPECLGEVPGKKIDGRIVSLLRYIGFDVIFDYTDINKLSIMAERKEIMDRIMKGGDLPVISMKCPEAKRYILKKYPYMKKYFSNREDPVRLYISSVHDYISRHGIREEDATIFLATTCGEYKEIDYRGISCFFTAQMIYKLYLMSCENDEKLAKKLWKSFGSQDFDSFDISELKDTTFVPYGENGDEFTVKTSTIEAIDTIINDIHKNDERGIDSAYKLFICRTCRNGCISGSGAPKAKDQSVVAARLKAMGIDD